MPVQSTQRFGGGGGGGASTLSGAHAQAGETGDIAFGSLAEDGGPEGGIYRACTIFLFMYTLHS